MLPIKLHIYGTNDTYVFIGATTDEVKRALTSVSQNAIKTKDEKILKGEFGAKWKQILGASHYSGGAALDNPTPDEPADEITLDDLNNIGMASDGAVAIVDADGNADDSGVPDTGADAADIAFESLVPAQITAHYDGKPIAATGPAKGPSWAPRLHFVYNMEIYEHDTIMDIKKKIAVVLNMPIYKQHIWYNYNNKIFNLNYELFINNRNVKPSFINVINDEEITDRINDIPILMDFYNYKNALKVKTYDTASLISHIVKKLGVYDFYIADMDSYITAGNISKMSSAETDILYYGFVVLFWPMLTYTCWIDYIKNQSYFNKIYPDLYLNMEHYKSVFNSERVVTDRALAVSANSKAVKDIESMLFYGIVYTVMSISSIYNSSVIDLRNLLDRLQLSGVIIGAKLTLIHEGKKVVINKLYKNTVKIPTVAPLNCLLIKIETELTTMDLLIFENGNYTIRARWPQEKLLNSKDIFLYTKEHIDRIIKIINKEGYYVFKTNAAIPEIDNTNYKFSETSVVYILRKDIKYGSFKAIDNIMRQYEQGEIVKIGFIEPTDMRYEYIFVKGMFNDDISRVEKNYILSNYYAFLSNASVKSTWNNLYKHNRRLSFDYISGSLTITINSLSEPETAMFYIYLLDIITQILNAPAGNVERRIITNNIKSLRQHDPVLYDFDRGPGMKSYSKICQKKHQPLIISKEEYEKLNKEQKERVVQYWNFTTSSKNMYFCPNKTYPFIQFAVNRHPKDYCIPCCQKRNIGAADNKLRQKIQEVCLKEYKYSLAKTNITENFRYIMNYGKIITPKKISQLPERSIDMLLYENFDENARGIDQPCEDMNRYYVYGVEQNLENLKNVGILRIMSFALDMPVHKLIDAIIKAIKASPNKFKILLNGEIVKYFFSPDELTDALYKIANTQLPQENKKWNEIFIDIAFHYMNLITVLFIDNSRNSEEIQLLLDSKISNQDIFNNGAYRAILVIKKKNTYNPIVFMNSIVYFRTNQIEKKVFSKDDAVIDVLKKFIIYYKSTSNYSIDINLDTVNLFIQSSENKYTIASYFVSQSNLCYYLEILQSGKKFYVPVNYSSYIYDDDVKVITECYNSVKFTTPLKLLNSFVSDYNRWIANKSAKMGFYKTLYDKKAPLEQQVIPIYNYIRVHKWLLLENPFKKAKPQVIGFTSNGLNFYHASISKEAATHLHPVEFEQMLYHPDEVNAVFSNRDAPSAGQGRKGNPARADRLSATYDTYDTYDTYEYHLYEILLLAYTYTLTQEKNAPLRHKIKKIIVAHIDTASIKAITDITDLIVDYYSKYPNEPEAYKIEDVALITAQINKYTMEHSDKKILLKEIDGSYFNFDKVKINMLKNMPRKEVMTSLVNISKTLIQIASKDEIKKALSKQSEFPNILSICNKNEAKYCKNNKLLITKEKLNDLLEIMASDILNPFKQKWIFNPLFATRSINFFRFERRDDEVIFIDLY